MSGVWVYLKKYKWECIFGPFFKFLEVIFELLLPTIMALIVNKGVVMGDKQYIIRMGILMIFLALCGYGCAFICQRVASRASQGFGTLVRSALFKKILSFSYTQSDKFGAPTLTTRLTNDVNQLQLGVAMAIRLVSRSPFICIGSIIMAFFLDTTLALVLLASTPVLAFIIYYITKNTAPLYRAYQKKLDKLSSVIRENLSGVRVIRGFSKEKYENERFNKENDELLENGLKIGRYASYFNPLTSLVVNLMIVLIMWFGGVRINSGILSQGEIIAFINYVSQILLSLLVLSNLIILLTKSMASAARINEVLKTEPDMVLKEADDDITEDVNAAAIEFYNVSFGYNVGGDKALENISFNINKGETVGIIGGTGSGKTTLINLMLRFYDVFVGEVKLNGINVKEYTLNTLQKKIGLVPQKVMLFSSSVYDNIKWGNENANEDDVKKAARIAQAEEFIENLPNKYDEYVQRGGKNLSGGQRQRLTIARALVKEPEILILDDASSALDFLTDYNLRKAIKEESTAKTVILVSQRVGVVRSAQKIIVMEDGRVVGIGTHEQLYKTCDEYREICLSQLSSQEAEQ